MQGQVSTGLGDCLGTPRSWRLLTREMGDPDSQVDYRDFTFKTHISKHTRKMCQRITLGDYRDHISDYRDLVCNYRDLLIQRPTGLFAPSCALNLCREPMYESVDSRYSTVISCSKWLSDSGWKTWRNSNLTWMSVLSTVETGVDLNNQLLPFEHTKPLEIAWLIPDGPSSNI